MGASVAWLHPVLLCSSPTLCLQKVESSSDSDSKAGSDSELGNATVNMPKSDSNSDSDSDVSVKKAPRGRKPGNTEEVASASAGSLGDWRDARLWGLLLPQTPSSPSQQPSAPSVWGCLLLTEGQPGLLLSISPLSCS